jgi:hypothetical protein
LSQLPLQVVIPALSPFVCAGEGDAVTTVEPDMTADRRKPDQHHTGPR